MLNKCVTTKATLLVPDMEDSVPPHEKLVARQLIHNKLKFIREKAFSPNVVITPRTNAPGLGQIFTDDVQGVITQDTAKLVDGICVPKVDTLQDLEICNEVLGNVEKNLSLPEFTFKLIPQIESTLSLCNMQAIFSADKKRRIIAAAFGADDFTADYGVFRSDDDKEIEFARKLFAVTCHAYGITSIDTPYVHYKN